MWLGLFRLRQAILAPPSFPVEGNDGGFCRRRHLVKLDVTPTGKVDVLYFNADHRPKIFSGGSCSHIMVRVPPKACVPKEAFRGEKPYSLFTEMDGLRALFPGGEGKLYLHRSYAMGDVIMLIPLIRQIESEFPLLDITVLTKDQFRGILGAACIKTDRMARKDAGGPPPWDVLIDLDTALESDHHGGANSYKHRVDIYCESLGLDNVDVDENIQSYWGIEIPEDISSWAMDQWDVAPVVLQWAGSTACKTLPLETKQALLSRLSTEGYDTMVLDPSQGATSADHHTTDLLRGLDRPLLRLVALLQECRAIVCMDSGPLWLAHLAGTTPVVALLGPTREEERLTKFPSRYEVVRMEESVGCSPCFEQATACGYRFSCMDPDSGWLSEEVLKKLTALES